MNLHGNVPVVPEYLWTPSKTWFLAKGHLNRFSRLCRDDRKLSLYFTMGRPFPPHNCPFPWVDVVPWTHPSPQHKQHLDPFTSFCRAH